MHIGADSRVGALVGGNVGAPGEEHGVRVLGGFIVGAQERACVAAGAGVVEGRAGGAVEEVVGVEVEEGFADGERGFDV